MVTYGFSVVEEFRNGLVEILGADHDENVTSYYLDIGVRIRDGFVAALNREYREAGSAPKIGISNPCVPEW